MRKMGGIALVATIGLALWVAGTTCVQAEEVKRAPAIDRLQGYYYPPVTSRESYVSRAKTLEDSTRARRLGFVSGLTQQLANMPYAPTYAIFAKGEDATRLIVVAYGDGQIDTVYRARALFASLTGLARLTPLFQQLQVEEVFTFFDLCKLLGFKTITVSDGRKFTHQVTLK